MRAERADEVRRLYNEDFARVRDTEWTGSYLAAVSRAAEVSEQEFRAPDFQRWLWEVDGVAGIGPGSSVTVPGAYTDPQVINALWLLKTPTHQEDAVSRARQYDTLFKGVIGLVSPRHNERRPKARLARIFAVLRPHDVLCLLHDGLTRDFRLWLEEPKHEGIFISQHVFMRQALREVLGDEGNLEGHVRYSQFAWFVWDQHLKETDPQAIAVSLPVDTRATVAPRLAILPAIAQRKGMPFVAGNLNVLLSMARAAQFGIDRASLDRQVAEDAPTLKSSSRANVLAQSQSLGVLAFENGTYRPTEAGKALLEGEAPSDVLTPIFAKNVFGFAQILDDLGGKAELQTRGQIIALCRGYYPRWTTGFAPNQLISWMQALGLVTIEGAGPGAKIRLTEAGEYWRSGLPPEMKRPALLLANELPDEEAPQSIEDAEEPAAPVSFGTPSITNILERFKKGELLSTLVFSDSEIAQVHAAMHAVDSKRLVLLAGLSGTGKTSMASGYARAYCEVLSLPFLKHYLQVAVWPDWTDPTGLLGFVNPLASPPSFQETPTLQFLLNASANPTAPYFLCLDEMNLARVEHYFAPFLSAMEGREGRLTLHSGREAVDQIAPSIAWPKNLFIIGTVNMDETTYPFSDKVLDRAFTFEFWNVDLDRWHSLAVSQGRINPSLEPLLTVLRAFSDALKPARRHFGYRTCDEVLGFIRAAAGMKFSEALDAAVLAKILPKIRGDSGGALPDAIATAIGVAEQYDLKACALKLKEMQATLNELGTVRFWK